MSDISFSTMIQDILSASGYTTSSIATDEDGYAHEIKFNASGNRGVIYTYEGIIVMIKGEQI